MNEEKMMKNILITVLFIIIIGLAFVLFDITKNDSSFENSASDSIPSADNNEIDVVENAVQKKETYTPPPPKPATTLTPKPEPVVLEPGMVIVTYTDSGFIPPVVEVTAGGSITFINSSSKPLRVTAGDNLKAEAETYRGLNQGKSMSTGGIYIFSFTEVGIWGYRNLNLESHLGYVSVIPQ